MSMICRREGDITIRDLQAFHAWEDVSPATEAFLCTYKPFDGRIVPVTFRGFVTTDFGAASGDQFVGTIEPMWSAAARSERFTDPMRAHHQIWCRADGSPAWASLYLGDLSRIADDLAEENKRKVLQSLGVHEARLFPMLVRPRVRIDGFPESWRLDGFMMTDRDGRDRWIAVE